MQRLARRRANQDTGGTVSSDIDIWSSDIWESSYMWTAGFPNALRLVQQFVAPLPVFIIAGIFSSYCFVSVKRREGIWVVLPHPSAAKPSSQSPLVAIIDADIAGIGIRIALWVQIGALVILTFVGSIYCRALGAKEIGAGLVVTHTSLAVALVVQMKYGTMTSADAIVGAMLLDAQGSAMSIVLVAKNVLAARWQTWISIFCQTFGLTVLFICVIKFGDGDFVNRSDDAWLCLKPFWWGWIADCPETAEAQEFNVFWLYLVLRVFASIHTALFAATNTGQFHCAEKRGEPLRGILFSRTPASIAEESQVPGSQTPSPESSDDGTIEDLDQVLYSNCRATVTWSYAIHVILSFMSMVAAQMAMNAGMEASSGAISVGQIISMVVAIATALRVLWLVLRAIDGNSENSEGRFCKAHRFVLEFFAQAYRSVLAFVAQAYQANVREDRAVELDAREQA